MNGTPRRVDGRWNLQIAPADIDAGLYQPGHLLRVADEHTNRRAALGEQTRRFRANLSSGGNENHGCAPLRLGGSATQGPQSSVVGRAGRWNGVPWIVR